MKLQAHETGSFVAEDDPGEPSTKQPRLSVTPEEAQVLAALARDARVLEIGTGLGVSTRALASTARFVTTVDIDEWVHQNVFPLLQGIRTMTNFNGLQGDKYDLIFIDGAHDMKSVTQDVLTAREYLAKNGLILVHDHGLENVRKALFQLGIHPVVIQTKHEIAMVFSEA